jgi:hypothetical protein
MKTIERLSAEPIQQKQGLRENHSTFSRAVQNGGSYINIANGKMKKEYRTIRL